MSIISPVAGHHALLNLELVAAAGACGLNLANSCSALTHCAVDSIHSRWFDNICGELAKDVHCNDDSMHGHAYRSRRTFCTIHEGQLVQFLSIPCNHEESGPEPDLQKIPASSRNA